MPIQSTFQKIHSVVKAIEYLVFGNYLVYIDVFVFSKEGNIKSFVSVFEIEPSRDCEKTWEDFVYNYKVDTYFIQSRIQKNYIIKRTEKRFGMTIKTELQLQKDGYLKEIKLKKEGKNEWLED
mgnify:CR=1 FL=1